MSGHIEDLTLSCTLSTQLPDVQIAVLKSLDCPNLYVSKWVSPGYYTTIKRIRFHVSYHLSNLL